MLRILLYTFLLALGYHTTTFAYLSNTLCTAPKPFQDWIYSDDCQYLCGGYYQPRLAPPYSDPDEINLEAEETALSVAGQSTFSGKVEIAQGDKLITAEQADLTRDAETGEVTSFSARNNLIVSDPAMRIEATHGFFDTTQDYGKLECAQFRFYPNHARGAATQVELFGRNCLKLKKASYTTCGPDQNFWCLRAQRVTLNKTTGRGEAYHARFYVKDVPVAYLPYLNFPIDKRRQTGFLYPSAGYDSRSGWTLRVPFYWNIAPNYDATLAYKHFSRRGEQLQTYFRYLSLYHQGRADFDYMPHDRAYKKFVQDTQKRSPNAARYRYRWQERFQQDPNWFGHIDFHQVSDDEYLIDFAKDLDTSNQTQLRQHASIGFAHHAFKIQTKVQKYKTLHPFDGPIVLSPYQLMPQVDVQLYPDPMGPCEARAFGQFTQFNTNRTGVPTGRRAVLIPSLSTRLGTPGWFIQPKVGAYALHYALKQPSPNTHPRHTTQHTDSTAQNLAVPILNLNSGLVFERKAHCAGQTFWQTLEPKLYYLLIPYKDQSQLPLFDTSEQSFSYAQLYRINRFSGFDRIGDANQATLGLEHRWFNCDTGEEKLLVGIGEIFYFRARKVTLRPDNPHNRSPLTGYMQYQINPCWRAYGETYWDTYQNYFVKNTFGAQYCPIPDTVFNVGYDFIREARFDPQPTHQIHASAAYRLSPQYRLMGKYHYDFKRGITRSIWAGFEVEGCCGALRVLASRYLKPSENVQQRHFDTAVYVQLIFKGLGGVGTHDFDSVIKKEIPGYQWVERF